MGGGTCPVLVASSPEIKGWKCFVHFCPCPCFENLPTVQAFQRSTLRTTLSRVLAVMSSYRVTTACVSSLTNWTVSIASHMQQNKFLCSPQLQSGTSVTWTKNIGDGFLVSTIVHSAFQRVLYHRLDDIRCVFLRYQKKMELNTEFLSWSTNLRFWVASCVNSSRCCVGTVSRRDEVVFWPLNFADVTSFSSTCAPASHAPIVRSVPTQHDVTFHTESPLRPSVSSPPRCPVDLHHETQVRNAFIQGLLILRCALVEVLQLREHCALRRKQTRRDASCHFTI